MATKAMPSKNNGGLSLTTVGSLNEFFRPWSDLFAEPAGRHALTTPAVNITETDKSYNLLMAAPGLNKEDFNIDVRGGLLTISAGKKESAEEQKEAYTRQEYNYSSFSRSFTLPDAVKQDAIEAGYKDGVLQLVLLKKEAAPKTLTKVQIK